VLSPAPPATEWHSANAPLRECACTLFKRKIQAVNRKVNKGSGANCAAPVYSLVRPLTLDLLKTSPSQAAPVHNHMHICDYSGEDSGTASPSLRGSEAP